MPKEKTKEKAYKVKVDCTNCEWCGEVEVPMGTSVDQFPCPNCGCKELEKA